MKRVKYVLLVSAISLISTGHGLCQSNLRFTTVSQTAERAILLNWVSQSNHIYQIQYANALATNANGSTAFQILYDGYPSHGTNTFIGDYGNYDVALTIPHPKYLPMRFYRVLDEGTNTSASSPFVVIISPTNGNVLSGQVTVTVVATSANLPILTTKLFVDGQQMDESDDGSNYVINTCEWPNGAHTLFATATGRSGLSGPSGSYPIYTGQAVSSYVPVTSSNLISRIAFSQAFFEPSLGQTQEVTATFAANCNWTLQIQDANSNTVRNASGSGNSMTFDWDGTGDGETNILDGVYTYLISAATNGGSFQMSEGGSGDSSGPPSSSFASSLSAHADSPELWAMPINGSGGAVPLAIYPSGFDTNYLTIFEASPSQMQALNRLVLGAESNDAIDSSSDVFTDEASPAYTGPSGQSSSAPTRPPTSPTKNAAGNYAIGYYSWPSPQTVSIPKNGMPFPATGVCHLDGSSSSSISFDNIPEAQTMSQNMERAMKRYGWKLGTIKGDQALPVNSIRRSDQGYGGGEYFTTATIGLFLDHGDYGTDPDYNPGSSGSDQTYFRSDVDSGDNGWLRMCQFGFGGNLKWMGVLACNSLTTYSSMVDAGAIPLKTTHLVCGASTIAAVGEDIGANWTKNMLKKKQAITDAWFNAGRSQYQYATNLTGTISFRVAGYPECMSDTVKNNTAPSSPSPAPGNLTVQDSQVYP